MKIVCPFHKNETLEINQRCPQCNFSLESYNGIDFKYSAIEDLESSFDYENEYSKIAKEDLSSEIYSHSFQRYMAEVTASYIFNIYNKDIAELGVGKGELINILVNKKPNSITLFDIAPEFLQRVKATLPKKITPHSNITTALGNVEYLPFYNSFDTIIATDILEHVMNLGNALDRISKSLKVGGYFFCRVPFNEALGQYSIYNGCEYKFAHLRSFNKQILKTQFQEVDLDIEDFYRFCFLKGRYRKNLSRLSLRVIKRICHILRLHELSDIDFNKKLSRRSYGWLRKLHEPIEVLVVARKISSEK